MPIDANGRWYPDICGKQLEVFNTHKRYTLVDGPKKCLEKDAIVWTSNGLARLEDLVQGECVTSFDEISARFTKGLITATHANPSKEAINITLRNQHAFSCSPNHPLWTFTGGKFSWMRADQISSSKDTVWIPQILEHKSWDQTDLQYAGAIPIDADVGYLVGVMIGDGCMTPKVMDRATPSLHSVDDQIVNEVARIVSKLGGRFRHSKNRRASHTLNGPSIKGLIHSLDLVGYSYTKRIPNKLIASPKHVIRAMLQGLFDTDGWSIKKDGGVWIAFSNEKLVYDVAMLLRAFGVETRLRCKSTSHLDSFELTVINKGRFYEEVGFRLDRKQERIRHAVPKSFEHRGLFPPEMIDIIRKLYVSRQESGCRTFTKYERKLLFYPYLYGAARIRVNTLEKFLDSINASDTEFLKDFRIDNNVSWIPVDRCKPVEADMLDIQVDCYHSFVANGTINHNSGKSIANLHRLARHLWEVPSRVGVFTKTLRNAKSGGVWNDLLDIILPEWFDSGIGIRFTTRKSDGTYGPKQDANTRMQYFKVRNSLGGQSEVQLHSIDNEKEVESIAKGTRFSMFYFAELSNFKNRLVFDITSDQLRMPSLAFEDHLWLADTNPSDDGPDSWIYKLWYSFLEMEDCPQPSLQRNLHRIQIMIEDNPYLSEEEVNDLKERFIYDPDLYARYIEGKWVHAVKDALFENQFKPAVHVLGNTDALDEDQWEILLPSDNCSQLLSGWDLGDRYHSAHIVEKVTTANGQTFLVLDECCKLNPEEQVSIKDFTEEFLELYEFWMKRAINGRTGPDGKPLLELPWTHWADSQALNSYRSGADNYDANLVYSYSDGRIAFNAAPKFPGSVQTRIRLVKTLLFEGRLLISAKCQSTIQMFKSLKSGSGAKAIAPSKHRHPFDSLSYLLASEEPWGLLEDLEKTGNDEKEPAIVMIQ